MTHLKRTTYVLMICAAMFILLTLTVAAEEKAKTFNDYVLEVMESYPTDGSQPYAWVNEPNYYGITRDLVYQGQLFIKGDAQKRSYCSGITFEVFLQAYNNYNTDHGLTQIGNITTLEQMEEFRRKWYGVGGDRRTIKHALEFTRLGYQVADLSEVEKGDFVQLWRHSGSGHTVIFIQWVKDTEDKIIGFEYWSSNTKRGPSYQIEYFGDAGKLIIMNETYFMKIIDPIKWVENNKQ